MITDDRVLRIDDDQPDLLLAGALELDPSDSRVGLTDLIDRMSEGGQSAAALDLIAIQVARLLVADHSVDDLLQGIR